MVKSDILPYEFEYLRMVKNIWPHSKNIELGQKILNTTKQFFELADGLGISFLFRLLETEKNLWKKLVKQIGENIWWIR